MSTEAFLIPIETDEHQSPLALADAAILERWEFSEAGDPAPKPLCGGTIRGHPVVKDGTGFVDEVIAVAKDRTWVRTSRELFKLGTAKRWWPLSQVVTAFDWTVGLLNLLDEEGWPADARGAALGLDASSDDWPKRREAAYAIRNRLHHHNRHDLADAFRVLEADVGDRVDCTVVVGLLEQAIGRRKIHPLDDALKGWRLLSEGCRVESEDPVIAAKRAVGSEIERRIIGRLTADPSSKAMVREEDYADECQRGIVVIAKFGGVRGSTAKEALEEFKEFIGCRTPAYPVGDLAEARAELCREFPHAESLIDIMLSDLPGREIVRLRPTLVVGPPGCGKSRLARRLGEALGVHVGSFDGAGAGDAAFGGTGRRWSSGEPCYPLMMIKACGHANPIVMVDEIDKAGTSCHNGSLYNSILTLLENETSSRFADPYIQAPVDVSHVSYVLTANDDTVLPATLKDRCRILRMPAIKPEHVPAIARGLVADIAQERGLDMRWVSPLNGDELEIAQRMLGDGSIRRLRAVVERLLIARETSAPRN